MSIWYWIAADIKTLNISDDLLKIVQNCENLGIDLTSSKTQKPLYGIDAVKDWLIINNVDTKTINLPQLSSYLLIHDQKTATRTYGLHFPTEAPGWKKHFVEYNDYYPDLARYAFLFLDLIKDITITKFEIESDLEPWITTPFFGIRTILYGGTLEEDMLKLFNNIKKHSMHLSYQDTPSTSNEVTFTNALVELKEFGVSTYNLDCNGISVRISFYNSFFILQPLDANGTLHHNPTSDEIKKLIKIALFLCDDFRIERIEMNFEEAGITCI